MDRNLLLYLLAQKGIDPVGLEEILGWSQGTRMHRMHGRNWKADELKVLIKAGFTRDEIWNVFFKEEKR